jgi:phosphatidylinositol-3-phosphatase
VSARSRLIRIAVGAMLMAAMTLPGAGVLANSSANANLKHVFVIMLENHSQSTVIGDANAPYITSLAHTYGMAADYYGVTHPSLPNYVAAISGSNWFVQTDDPSVRFSNENLVDQLESHGKTWAAYMEAMPANDKLTDYWPSSANALYASKHNPFVLFDDIRNNPSRMANVKPYSDFAGDLASGNVADFVWISPDQCNDMHGGVYGPIDGHPETTCPYGSAVDDPNDASLKQKADAFVQAAVHAIMSSKAWTGNSAIFILTDENDYTGNPTNGGWESTAGCCDSPIVQAGDTRISGGAWTGGVYGGGLIPAIVVTTHGVRQYVSDQPYNHYSLLRTVEEAWSLGYLGNASDANNVQSMKEFFSHH